MSSSFRRCAASLHYLVVQFLESWWLTPRHHGAGRRRLRDFHIPILLLHVLEWAWLREHFSLTEACCVAQRVRC